MADQDRSKDRTSQPSKGNSTESNPYNPPDQKNRDSDRSRQAQPGETGNNAQDDDMHEDMEDDDDMDSDDLDSGSKSGTKGGGHI